MVTAMISRMMPLAMPSAPGEKWSSLVSRPPRTSRSAATVAAVVSILRMTRRLVAFDMPLVMSRNGTSAILGPMPIRSSRNVSMTKATFSVSNSSIPENSRSPGTHRGPETAPRPAGSLHPVQDLPHQVHRGVRVQEREPGDRLALPRRRRDEGHLVVEELVGPLRVLLRGPAAPAEQHDAEVGLADQLQVPALPDLGGGSPGQRDRRLDRIGVGPDPVYRQGEPQRQPARPSREVVGVVGRVPLRGPVVD